MAMIPKTVERTRKSLMPDWQQNLEESTDPLWQLHGKQAAAAYDAAKTPVAPPEVKKPVAIPDAEAVKRRARRRSAARRGRESTIYTSGGPLGGETSIVSGGGLGG